MLGMIYCFLVDRGTIAVSHELDSAHMQFDECNDFQYIGDSVNRGFQTSRCTVDHTIKHEGLLHERKILRLVTEDHPMLQIECSATGKSQAE